MEELVARYKIVAVAGAVFAASLAWGRALRIVQSGVTVIDLRWKAIFADQQALQAKGLTAATAANRIEEQRRQTAGNQVANDAREQTKAAVADGAADDAGGRVRQQAGTFAAGASCAPVDPEVARRGASATRTAMVLSYMFQRADKRAGELANVYDAARIAGLAC